MYNQEEDACITNHDNENQFSSDICDLMRGQITKKIVKYQSLLKDIQLLEELNSFGDLGVFNISFVRDLEWLRDVWCNEEVSSDIEKVQYVKDRLKALPFERAFCYKNTEYYTKLSSDIFKYAFKDNAVNWRNNPSSIETMSRNEKERIFGLFEYMCYFIINVRDELLFDIQQELQ